MGRRAIGVLGLVATLGATAVQASTEVPEFAPGFRDGCQRPGAVPQDKDVERLFWFRCRNSDTVVVFVHGFNSNNRAAWLHGQGSYWPLLINGDSSFDGTSVVLAPFFSQLAPSDYGLQEASNALWEALVRPEGPTARAVLDHRQVIFVAHSTGGVLVRNLLFRHRHGPALRGKSVGLLLVASPTEGSEVLRTLRPLVTQLSNRMLEQLAPNSAFLAQLKSDFKDLVTMDPQRRGWTLVGRELAETEPVTCDDTTMWRLVGCLRSLMVVTPESAGAHFADPVPVPRANHIDIAKPVDLGVDPHRTLARLYRDHFAGLVRPAAMPIPYFYSVVPSPEPQPGLRAELDPPAPVVYVDADVKPLELAVLHGACLDRPDKPASTGQCTRQFEVPRPRSADIRYRVVACEIAKAGKVPVCTTQQQPADMPAPGIVQARWVPESGLTAGWHFGEASSVEQPAVILASASTDEARLFSVRLQEAAIPRRAPPPRPPPAPATPQYFSVDAATDPIPRADRASAPGLRFTLFPNRVVTVVPGHESPEAMQLLKVEVDAADSGKVRYRPLGNGP